MTRKVVQISTSVAMSANGNQIRALVAALCNDGTIFTIDVAGHQPAWRKVPSIPKPDHITDQRKPIGYRGP